MVSRLIWIQLCILQVTQEKQSPLPLSASWGNKATPAMAGDINPNLCQKPARSKMIQNGHILSGKRIINHGISGGHRGTMGNPIGFWYLLVQVYEAFKASTKPKVIQAHRVRKSTKIGWLWWDFFGGRSASWLGTLRKSNVASWKIPELNRGF